MEALLNRMRLEAERVGRLKGKTRLGTITSYDPNNYAVKVLLQPDGTETGFIPLTSPMVGNGWGMFFAPQTGDQVIVEFQEDGHEVPLATLRLFDDQNRPLSVASGDMWFVSQAGDFIKIKNGTGIEISTGGSVKVLSGDIELGTGSLQTLVMQAFMSVYNGHTHTVTAVGAPTSAPNTGGQMLMAHLTTNTKAS